MPTFSAACLSEGGWRSPSRCTRTKAGRSKLHQRQESLTILQDVLALPLGLLPKGHAEDGSIKEPKAETA